MKQRLSKKNSCWYFLLSAAIVAVLAVFVIFCGHVPKKQNGCLAADAKHKHAVTIWASGGHYNMTAIREAAASYQKQHPDTAFEMVCMTQEEMEARLKSLMLTGSRRLLPDLALIADYRIQYFLQNYEQEFLPLGDLVDPSEYAPCKTGVSQAGGTVYGVPFDSGAAGLFYRLDLIQQAGFTQQDMQDLTWEAYIRIGKKVREQTGKAMLAVHPTDLVLIRMMLSGAGSWYTDADGRLDLKGNLVLEEAMRLYQKIVQAGITLTVADWSQYVHAFWEGEVATVLNGSWMTASISSQKQQKGLWRMARVPRMEQPGWSVNAAAAGGSGWYVFRYAQGAQQAKQFLGGTFASDPKLLSRLTEKIGLVSTWKPAKNHAVYQKPQPYYGNQKIYQDLLRWTYEINQVNYGTHTYEAEQLVADALQQVLDGENIRKALAEYQEEYEWQWLPENHSSYRSRDGKRIGK